MIPFSSWDSSPTHIPAQYGWPQCQHWYNGMKGTKTPEGGLPVSQATVDLHDETPPWLTSRPGHSSQFLLCSHPEVFLEGFQ